MLQSVNCGTVMQPSSHHPSPDLPPHALALFDLARTEGALHGQFAVAHLPRLCSLLARPDDQTVTWSLRGFNRDRVGLHPQPMASLHVQAALRLTCQRCLQEMVHAVDETAMFRLVKDEPELTQEELDAPDEALAAQSPVDVRELIEDQLILALPLVPMHAVCPTAAPQVATEPRADEAPKQQPFAGLRDLLNAEKKR